MQKTINKIIKILIFCLTFALIFLRFYQLFNLTSTDTGNIIQGAEKSIFGFYILTILLTIANYYNSHNNEYRENLFTNKNKLLSYFSILAGLSLLYDFVHQCINVYNYIETTFYIQLNYLIPMGFVGFFAIISAFYFIIMGVSLKSENYNFTEFKIFHLVPSFWILFRLLENLIYYVDSRYAVENVLMYLVLVFGIIFFFMFFRTVYGDKLNPKLFHFVGIMYALFSFSLSIPRIAIFIIGKGALLSSVTYSSVTDLCIGIFVLHFSLLLKNTDKKDI